MLSIDGKECPRRRGKSLRRFPATVATVKYPDKVEVRPTKVFSKNPDDNLC